MKVEKIKKLAGNLHNEKENVTHIRNLKQSLNHQIVLKKEQRVIKFNQKAWLKSYIDIKEELKKMQKNISKKIFLT